MTRPSLDAWLQEAKASTDAGRNGMYLIHNGVVRETTKAKVRLGKDDNRPVKGMDFRADHKAVERAIASARTMPGITCVKVWLNEGILQQGDDIMLVLVAGDIRPHVITALETLVGTLKNECVREVELF